MSERLPRMRLKLIVVLILALLAALPTALPADAQTTQKISRLGQYSGYSAPLYDEWVRSSSYVTVRDGTRLAVDVIRPAVNGAPVEAKLPTIYVHERYQRALFVDGVPTTQPRMKDFWEVWVSHGYALVSADIRGGGASFGTRRGEIMDVDSTDAYDVIEWIAAQPWSNGRVGMTGVSYNAITQFMAAGAAPPALKAIMPYMVLFDLYMFVYPGGVFRYEFLRAWALTSFTVDKVLRPVPVDEDESGALAAAAVAEHRDNANVYETSGVPFRDSLWAKVGNRPYIDWTLNRFLEGINRSGVAVYQTAGWFDMWPRDQAAWFNNLKVPQRIVFGPFSHAIGFAAGWQRMIKRLAKDVFDDETIYEFHMAESLRFFDFHLKGIDNGIMEEPPVWYYVMGAPAGQAWRSAGQWPLPNEVRTRFYFQGGPSGSIDSVNDGMLSAEKPAGEGEDAYTVDYSTTSGTGTRWHNGHGGPIYYDDMTEQGKKSLTYTTPPLSADTEITGHPVVHLWVASSADDGDFFVYLEEVDKDGYAQYITEGVLRGSHRMRHEPAFNFMGLPWHRGNEADVQPMPKGEPVELVFDLHPTSNIFDAGHRIRVRVVGADADNYLTPTVEPAPTIRVFRGTQRSSYIDLPVIPAR